MAATKTRTPGAGAGYTVLVVDDDPRIVELLHIALGAHSYRVISAGNGEDALRLAFNEQPDMLILDVRLPRRSGYEVCRAIRREPELADLPVIMVSALSDTEARLQGLERGADDYLAKPFSPKELIAKVKRCIERTEKVKALHRRSRELSGELDRTKQELEHSMQDLQRQRARQDASDRLAADLARLTRPDEVVSTFLFSLMTQLGTQTAALLESDEGGTEKLRPTVARGLSRGFEEGLVVDPEGELSSLLLSLGRPVRREELERFPEMREEMGPLVTAGIAVLVPVVSRGSLSAVALLGEKTEPGPYTSVDIEMASGLSQAAALAVEQGSLMRRARQAFEQAVHAYLGAVETRDAQTAWRASTVGGVCEVLARELGCGESIPYRLRLEAISTVLEEEAPMQGDRSLRIKAFETLKGPSSLEAEVLKLSRKFVEGLEELEEDKTPDTLLGGLEGDPQILRAFEETLKRGDLLPKEWARERDTQSKTTAA